MHPFVLATVGGAMIGAAAVLLMALNGRIAGVSGILAGAFHQPVHQRLWRWLFVFGLVLGGALPALVFPDLKAPEPQAGIGLAAAAGLIVGLGTGVGSGCTSGHGICGISRFSKRSVVATLTFMAAGIATVTALRWLPL